MANKLVDAVQTFFGRRDLVLNGKVIPVKEIGKTYSNGEDYARFIQRETKKSLNIIQLPKGSLERLNKRKINAGQIGEYVVECITPEETGIWSFDSIPRAYFRWHNYRAKLAGV